MTTFSKALDALKEGNFVKRSIIKNDDAIVNYKQKLYWLNKQTGIRYPYHPSNKDLMADDWLIFMDTIKPRWVMVDSLSNGIWYLHSFDPVKGACFITDYDLAMKFFDEESALSFAEHAKIVSRVTIEEHSY